MDVRKFLIIIVKTKLFYLRNNIVDDNCPTTIPNIKRVLDENLAIHGSPNSTSASFSAYIGLLAPKIVVVEKVEASWRVNDACSSPV